MQNTLDYTVKWSSSRDTQGESGQTKCLYLRRESMVYDIIMSTLIAEDYNHGGTYSVLYTYMYMYWYMYNVLYRSSKSVFSGLIAFPLV